MAIYLYRHTDTTDTNTDTATPASVVQTVGVAFVIIEHRELNIAFTPPHTILLVLVSNLFNWLMIRDGQLLMV